MRTSESIILSTAVLGPLCGKMVVFAFMAMGIEFCNLHLFDKVVFIVRKIYCDTVLDWIHKLDIGFINSPYMTSSGS